MAEERVFRGNRELTSEEILAKCPESIDPKEMMAPKRGRPPRHGTQKLKWHSEADRIRVATVYATTGSAAETSKITGVPAGTVRQWRTQDWWPQVIERIQSEVDDELDVKFTGIVQNTIDQINDRIRNGDYIYDRKNGVQRVPAKMKDLGVTASIFMDKRDLIRRKQKTAIEQASTQEILKSIAETLRGFAKQPKTIEGEVIDVGVDRSGSAGSAEDSADGYIETGCEAGEPDGTNVEAGRENPEGELPSGGDREGPTESGDPVPEVGEPERTP